MDKKGFQMVETYVVIIFAILVVVILIIFYDMQTGRFSSFFKDFVGKSNVGSMTALCNSLVSREARYEYCCARKLVKYEVDGKRKEKTMTCQEFSSMDFGNRVEKMICGDIC